MSCLINNGIGCEQFNSLSALRITSGLPPIRISFGKPGFIDGTNAAATGTPFLNKIYGSPTGLSALTLASNSSQEIKGIDSSLYMLRHMRTRIVQYTQVGYRAYQPTHKVSRAFAHSEKKVDWRALYATLSSFLLHLAQSLL